MALLRRLTALIEKENIWAALPHEMDSWWRGRAGVEPLRDGGGWHIRGEGSDSGRIAYASIDGDRVVYTVAQEECI